MRERERERERNGAPKSNVLTSRFPVANPKSGPDYSVFITIFFFNFTCPVRCFLRTPQDVFSYPRVGDAAVPVPAPACTGSWSPDAQKRLAVPAS
jgi:hypothetical protein